MLFRRQVFQSIYRIDRNDVLPIFSMNLQFTVEKKAPLNFCSLFKSINLGLCSKYRLLIILRIFLTVAVSVAACERSFSKLN